MQSYSTASQAKIDAGAAPIVRAYSRRRGDFPVLVDELSVHGNAFFGAVTTNYIHRFRLTTDNQNLQHQRIAIANLDTTWYSESWTTLVSYGGGFGASLPYVALLGGSHLILAWMPSNSQIHYRYSTDEGSSWSATQIYYKDAGSADFTGINAIQSWGINTGSELIKYYSGGTFQLEDTIEYTSSTVISHRPATDTIYFAGGDNYWLWDEGDWQTYRRCTVPSIYSGYMSYSVKLGGTTFSYLYGYIFSATTLNWMLARTSDGIYYSTDYNPEITAPLIHYTGGYYYSANGEKLSATKPETELPAILDYHFKNNKITINFVSQPTLSTDREIVVRRGLDEDNLMMLPPFINFHQDTETSLTGYCLPFAATVLLPDGQWGNTAEMLLEILPATNGMDRPTYADSFDLPGPFFNDTIFLSLRLHLFGHYIKLDACQNI